MEGIIYERKFLSESHDHIWIDIEKTKNKILIQITIGHFLEKRCQNIVLTKDEFVDIFSSIIQNLNEFRTFDFMEIIKLKNPGKRSIHFLKKKGEFEIKQFHKEKLKQEIHSTVMNLMEISDHLDKDKVFDKLK